MPRGPAADQPLLIPPQSPEAVAGPAVVDVEPAPPPADQAMMARLDELRQALASVTDHVKGLTDQSLSAGGVNREDVQAIGDEATTEILGALAGSEADLRRVEQVTSALSVELAEVGQSLSDQTREAAEVAGKELRDGFARLGGDVEALGESFADSLAQVSDRSAARDGSADAAPVETDHRVASAVTETAEAVARVETLVEDLITATEERPTDVSELTSRTLERLGLSVSAKLEATAITAAEAIERAAEEAIDRAVSQFKDLAPPVVDRSTTAAVTRLEERVAALTLQRDQHDQETKTTLNGLEETVGRLASAQAEDLERILDSFETTAGLVTASSSERGTSEDRLARVEEALAALSGLPESTEELTDSLAEQAVAFNAALEALRRRLSVRARQVATIDDASLSRLADLVADRMAAGPVPRPSTRRTASRAASAERATREDAPPAARRAARPARAAGGRRRPVD